MKRARTRLVSEFNVTIAVRQPGPVSKPFVKDGLSVTVQATGHSFGPDDAIELAVTYNNISKAPLALWDVQYVRYWQVEFAQPGSEDRWVLRYPGKEKRGSIALPRLLQPGDSLIARLRLDPRAEHKAHHFTFSSPKEIHMDPRPHPPAGKWEVTIRIEVRAGKEELPFWTGTIATKPVTIEIRP